MNSVLKTAFFTITLLSSLLLLSSGCSKKTVIPPDGTPAAGSEMSGGTNINYPAADGSFSEDGLAAPESMDSNGNAYGNLSVNNEQNQSEEYKHEHGRSSVVFNPVYFDFDQAGLNAAMRPVVTANADYLKNNPDTVIVIEGNCDERGTNEYNLALGERRAINVKEYMVNLGINPMRIRTVSYGEERPLFSEQNEMDWSQNRRADFIVE
ncbi:MAG: peptidoglycan-associated lipoprotein Pal [Desulfocapsa sp.]|nr:MAG: peptidoglycan-associated lipoprotein Pal [Desulfocapsa sp.]